MFQEPPGQVPAARVRARNDASPNAGGEYVLYWMIAYRRSRWNFALQRAADWARELHKPLLILEALRCDYPWASDRLHRFVVDGMADNAAACSGTAASYYPYVEPGAGAGKGFLGALGERACAVVTDDYPEFFLRHAVDAAASQLGVLLEQVDSNGLLPMRLADRDFPTAHSFRRFLQRELPTHLDSFPTPDPLAGLDLPRLGLPSDIIDRWPPSPAQNLQSPEDLIASVLIDHSVPPVEMPGGSGAAEEALHRFLGKLGSYAEDRNHPDEDATSGLSPYLHFGHISAHEVFAAVAEHENWDPGRISSDVRGKRSGWWGMSESAEAFLDQLVTWRELGFNMCSRRRDYKSYDSLPDWAKHTLAAHSSDPREHVYSLEDFESARTHDHVWNAAQTQLLREGRIHNYMRMLWGKKILEWTRTPREALNIMVHLNDKYAIDGRDPNSYSGIFWVLGRYDRPWGPERPIYGKVRYMTSENTVRKLRVTEYLERYS